MKNQFNWRVSTCMSSCCRKNVILAAQLKNNYERRRLFILFILLAVTVYGHHIESRILKPWDCTKKATKLLPEIRHLKYADRLKTCKLPTIHYRQIRGDMIETYKILSGKYDMQAVPILTTSPTLTTRGNDLRLQKIVQDMICENSFY